MNLKIQKRCDIYRDDGSLTCLLTFRVLIRRSRVWHSWRSLIGITDVHEYCQMTLKEIRVDDMDLSICSSFTCTDCYTLRPAKRSTDDSWSKKKNDHHQDEEWGSASDDDDDRHATRGSKRGGDISQTYHLLVLNISTSPCPIDFTIVLVVDERGHDGDISELILIRRQSDHIRLWQSLQIFYCVLRYYFPFAVENECSNPTTFSDFLDRTLTRLRLKKLARSSSLHWNRFNRRRLSN